MEERKSSGRRRWRVARYAAPGVIVLAGAIAFFGVGRWLVVEDPLEKAHAIVVLSGGLPIRAAEAARLYRQGFAPRVWITHPHGAGDALRALGIPYVGEEFYSRKVLLSKGVPEDAIRAFEEETGNTKSELAQVAQLLQQEGDGTVIVVTTKAHTRRVRAIWKRVAGPGQQIVVRYPADDPYDGAHWWRNTRDALEVAREVLGLFNVWAGFPVRETAR